MKIISREIDDMRILNKEEFYKGVEKFGKHEKRDAMYKVASSCKETNSLIDHLLPRPSFH